MIRAKTLLLHIGSWKTGTTAIQSYLSRSASRLREAGVLYPLAMREFANKLDTAHHRLCQMLDNADGRMTRDLDVVCNDINAELQKFECDTLLLSSENFMGMNRPEALARYFKSDHVIILAALRPQAEFLNAMYYTEVCHLKVVDYPLEYFSNFDNRKFDYVKVLERWRSIWPSTEVRASLFQRGTESRSFPVQTFLHQIGLEWCLAPEENVVEHRTLPAQATLALRQLAASGYSDEDFFRVFQILHSYGSWFSPSTICFPPKVLRSVEDGCAASNMQLLRSYMPGEAEVAPMALPDQCEWEEVMMPLDRHLPTLIRKMARTAAN